MSQTIDPNAVLNSFAYQVEQEFVAGSAIAPALYHAATSLVKDTEMLPGGDVRYPIHEALNWHLTRFGRQARQSFEAVLLQHEDGSTWQAKLSTPRSDPKGKVQKYETPVGNGARAYLPAIPPVIRQRVGDRHHCRVPLTGSFWQWIEHQPTIPIVLTEGGKKGLAGFSLGFVTLALYGCHGGYRTKDALGNSIPPTLIPDLARFAVPGRPVLLAFDEDANEATRRRVAIALSRLGTLLTAQGCDVAIIRWNGAQGKGLDDLIVNAGASAWEQAYTNALPLHHWQIWHRLEQQLTYPASLRVNTGNLASLDHTQLPDTGIVAIVSAKGTGKTKLMTAAVSEQERVLSLTHRIALGRNLCSRLGLDYRSDLDKVKGAYINGEGYTYRIGSCVDGLLGIDPKTFAGGDLVLDEVTQVVRHLLTSSTCGRDGKRPALLARFRALVQCAKRVICADADLDNATLNYLRSLRGEHHSVFLLQNDFQSQSYPCRWLTAPDRTAITGMLLSDVAHLPAGQVLFVATDSKATSKALARLIAQQHPTKRVLLLNSETSGGDCEREFMQTPDAILERGDYDVLLCSPSVATGVSIECQGQVARVYGIFTGVSAHDGDISQALSRVREPVERIVWCAKTGSNYASVSRSLNPLEVRSHLQSQTTATVQLIRSSLKEDSLAGIGAIDWHTDPHLGLYCQLAANQNRSMRCLRDAVLIRLRYEGNQVSPEHSPSNPALRLLLAQTRHDLQQLQAESLVAAATLSYSEVLALEQKESLKPEEQLAIQKFHLLDFYGLEALTIEDCLWDQEGRRRGELLNLEAQLFPGVAIDRTARAIAKQAAWNQGYCPWDLSHAELRRVLRERLGFNELIQRMISGWQWCKYDLQPYAERARALAPQIKGALHFTITNGMSNTQIVHQLLSQLGLKFKPRWSRFVPGCEGEKLRTYALDQEHWARLWATLQRREARRQRLHPEQAAPQAFEPFGSPVGHETLNAGGDPALSRFEDWLTPDSLAQVTDWWHVSAADPELRQQVQQIVPVPILQYLGLIA